MSVRDKHRLRITDLLSASLLSTGLSQTSLRQLAAAAKISDRMLLYYFDDKADVMAAALSKVAAEMSVLLAAAIPESANLEPLVFVAKAAVVTQAAPMRPYMRLWVEVVAAASRGEHPYSDISSMITLGFIDWIESRLAGKNGQTKRANAAMILAMIDGIALLEVCGGEERARLAIEAVLNLSAPN
jgi:AcrR family transcriptional regulator